MPTDEALLEQAEDWKKKGNDSFGGGNAADAIKSYSQGIVLCDRVTVPATANALKATLLSNRAACTLKLLDLRSCIDDCTKALEMDPDAKLRTKLLFRRSKARFLLSNIPGTTNGDELLQDAAKDLLSLLQVDPKNNEANQLLTTVRAQHKQVQSKAATPAAKTLDALKKATEEKDQIHHVKILLGMLDNDLSNTAQELGRLNGFTVLIDLAKQYMNSKLAILCMQCISTSGSNPVTVRQYLVPYQTDLVTMIETASAHPDLIVSTLAILVRIMLHADRDDPNTDIVGKTLLDYDCIVKAMTVALQNSNGNNSVIRAVLDVLSTWTAGTDRDNAIRTSLTSSHISDPTMPTPKTPQEIRAFTPQELAAYKKRQLEQKTRDQAWAFERAILFTQNGGLKALLAAACGCDNHVVRREIAVAVGRMLACLDEDDKIKDAVKPFLQEQGGRKDDEPMIEEVFNEDGEEKVEEEVVVVTLETKMERALITSALLLSKKDVGAWALSFGWVTSHTEMDDLISSNDPRAMCLASEVLSAAATVEAVRATVTGMVSSGNMEKLMMSNDRDIRSGAASAVAKLGLAEKSKDEGDIMGLLQAACELLEDRNDEGDNAEVKKDTKKHELKHFNSFATSSVERAVEMITYLIPNTIVKEEIASGFSSRPSERRSALELLVQTADLPSAGESLSGFGLATIFQNLAATNEQIRKEAFEGKEVTMEQYDEMQRMGKTEEEKELMDKEKDTDTRDQCLERIRKMATANVPRALVTLTEGASEHSLEQIVLTMNRMADEQSVRGVLIQQGVLSACIKIEKNEGPTETDVMKKVIRLARHCIAKMLITTNPSLLTSAQRLGSVKPLIQLVRDLKASDLQQFEALMALTNIGSSGEDAKNRIVTERGIPSLHFAMFSDHEMVRRAATEAMCNLVPHKKMMEHLSEGDNLKLWLAFAVDFEDNYECARAAAGCLAMATQEDEVISEEFTKLEKFKPNMHALLESGRLEIMHRAFVLLYNLVLFGGEIRKKTIEAGLVEFCRAYVELQNHTKETLDFTPEERQILPVTVDIAKKIVKAADE